MSRLTTSIGVVLVATLSFQCRSDKGSSGTATGGGSGGTATSASGGSEGSNTSGNQKGSGGGPTATSAGSGGQSSGGAGTGGAGSGGQSTGGTGTGGAGSGGQATGGTGTGGAGTGGSEATGGGAGETGTGGVGTGGTAGQSSQLVLQNPTASFSQTHLVDANVGRLIDGDFSSSSGWAIARDSGTNIGPETAVLETSVDTPDYGSGTRLTFVLTQNYSASGPHPIGRFRLSLTTADRGEFADGNHGSSTPGDLGSDDIWNVLTPLQALADDPSVTLTVLQDDSVLANTHQAVPVVYTVVVDTPVTKITGFRIETLEDASLPYDGPGLQSLNGNFVLTEFEVYAAAQ